jgi:hypothetical protein
MTSALAPSPIYLYHTGRGVSLPGNLLSGRYRGSVQARFALAGAFSMGLLP